MQTRRRNEKGKLNEIYKIRGCNCEEQHIYQSDQLIHCYSNEHRLSDKRHSIPLLIFVYPGHTGHIFDR